VPVRIVGVIALFAAAVAVPIAAASGESIESEILIDDYHQEGDNVIFSGEVKSAKHACEKRRKVVVVGRDEQAGDAKRNLGSDRTNRRGRYKVLESIPFQEDWAFAKVKRARLENGKKCARARSPEISLAG
jgi:hypothetical protein